MRAERLQNVEAKPERPGSLPVSRQFPTRGLLSPHEQRDHHGK